MKFKKQLKRYCPHCKKHTTHKVTQFRPKARPKVKRHALKWGVRQMAKVVSGYGGFPRPKPHEKAKTAQKATLKYECSECGKKHLHAFGRTKKVISV